MLTARTLAWPLFVLAACSSSAPTAKPATGTTSEVLGHSRGPLPVASFERAQVRVGQNVRWLALGGGSDPMSNQVSLAQDLELFRRLVPGRGITLFASGENAQLALHQTARDPSDVNTLLAELFGVRGATTTQYQPARFPIDGPATAEQVRGVLRQLLAPQPAPLVVYAAAHGDRGAEPSESSLALWGNVSFTAHELIELLDQQEPPRPAQFVITSCFGGGFAELIFRHDGRLRSTEQCGVFAAPWDAEASGCDPNPDRRAQESYAIHLLSALRGSDRDGRVISAQVDLDGNGERGLLEAHTYARIKARSFDMPTTTSERFLRGALAAPAEPQGQPGELDPAVLSELREDLAVVRALSTELDLEGEAAAQRQQAELSAVLEDLAREINQAQLAEEGAFYDLRIALLERWPLLDHPWEARTRALLEKEGPAIRRMLDGAEAARSHDSAQRELEELLHQQEQARVAFARVARLTRAYETLRLGSALAQQNRSIFAQLAALRACERRPFSRTVRPN